MASTSSPRNLEADANSDLSRKRQRLSDSPKAPILIEELPPEVVGSSFGDAIEIVDEDEDGDGDGDGDVSMGSFSASFHNPDFDYASPLEALEILQCQIRAERTVIDAFCFPSLSDWLNEHWQQSIREDPRARTRRYMEDVAFFEKLGCVALAFLHRNADFFDPEEVRRYPDLKDHIIRLLRNLAKLSLRFASFLPLIVKDRLARRDSAHEVGGVQVIPLMNYMTLTANLLRASECTGATYLKSDIDLSHAKIRQDCVKIVAGGPNSRSILTLYCEVARNLGSIKDSWLALGALQEIMTALPDFHEETRDFVQSMRTIVLPTICMKHPRALPDGFHEGALKITARAVGSYVRTLNLIEASGFYKDELRKNDDALISDLDEQAPIPEALQRISNDDNSILCELLKDCWTMQASKAFIESDIMDIRSFGIEELCFFLRQAFNRFSSTSEGVNHPVLQYAARFLRVNGMVNYMFSASSHASLVTSGEPIVGFLGATHHYTNQDTDIIWKTAMDNVEADFVVATLDVLSSVCHYLSFNEILYIVKKYTSTSISKIVSHGPAISLLPKLLRLLEGRILVQECTQDRLAIACTSLDILRGLSTLQSKPGVRSLWNEASSALSPGALGTAERLKVYQIIAADLSYPGVSSKLDDEQYLREAQQATYAFEVLCHFLDCAEVVKVDSVALSRMLSVTSIVEGAEQLVQVATRCDEHARRAFDDAAFLSRLSAILRLTSLPDMPCDDRTEQLLFSTFFGARAVNNDVRNACWDSLRFPKDTLDQHAETAARLLRRFLDKYVPDMDADHATPTLIHFASEPIRDQIAIETDPDGDANVITLPLWHTLLSIANDCSDPTTAKCAADNICELLFSEPSSPSLTATAIKRQCAFVRDYLGTLEQKYKAKGPDFTDADAQRICAALSFLQMVLEKSQSTAYSHQHDKNFDGLVLGNREETADLEFYIQLFSPHADCRKERISVRAPKSTTVQQLDAALQSLTYGQDSRIIIGGRLIDRLQHADKTLAELGIERAGVITICPKYSSDDDLNIVLTRPGPVERELLAQYHHLEAFLDGPDLVASKAFDILSRIRPSSNARWRVLSADAASPEELLPGASPWRAMFSLHVMQSHMKDFASLGVADDKFIGKCIRLLMRAVMDPSREAHPVILTEVMRSLGAFLLGQSAPKSQSLLVADETSERPSAGAEVLSASATLFASRLTSILLVALDLPVQTQHVPIEGWTRTDLAKTTYDVLLQASRSVPSVLNAFLNHQQCVETHVRLLLGEEQDCAAIISNKIDSFCYETGTEPIMVDQFWRVVSSMLASAVKQPNVSTSCFILAGRLFGFNMLVKTDEVRLRALMEILLENVWDRADHHMEGSEMPTMCDRPLHGLLALLLKAVCALRDLKKPIGIPGLPIKLAERLLFPTESDNRASMHLTTRYEVYELIKATCETKADYVGLLGCATFAMNWLNHDPTAKYPGPEEWLRRLPSCGIPNLGQTCYMNSLLQQMFANTALRKFVLEVSIVNENQQCFLKHIQALFARMQSSNSPVADAWELVTALNIEPHQQEDVHSFYGTFLNKLEDCMPHKEARVALSSIFGGKSMSQIRGECGHVSERTEVFAELAITVKNKSSLHESLGEFVQGEPMHGSNKYRCLTCSPEGGGRLVNAMKRTCLVEVPDHLTLCLKRFTMESMLGIEGKINDRFEFPAEIDMAVYTHEHLEHPDGETAPDVFELTGVIVHLGTLDFGHYWSYVRLPGDFERFKWMKLEDQSVTECPDGIAEVQLESFGGLPCATGGLRADSAYVLFYQRKKSMERECRLVPLPDDLERWIRSDNLWRYNTFHLFSPSFIGQVEWLVEMFSTFIGAQRAKTSTEASDSDRADSAVETPDKVVSVEDACMEDDASEKLAEMAVRYLLRLALCDPQPATRVKGVLPGLSSAMTSQHSLPLLLLHRLTEVPHFFLSVWRQGSAPVKREILQFTITLLSAINNSHSEEVYMDCVERILKAHSMAIGPVLDNFNQVQLGDYLAFAASIAHLGPRETARVLDYTYLAWCFDIIYLQYHKESRLRHPELAKVMTKIDLTHQFTFVHAVLQHVNVGAIGQDASPTEMHIYDDKGVLLNGIESKYFSNREPSGKRRLWTLMAVGSQKCTALMDWTAYAPGKLVGLLANPQASPGWWPIIEQSLLALYDTEEYRLDAMLHLTRHVCAALGDKTARLLRHLGKTLVTWADLQAVKSGLRCFEDTLKSAPRATLDSVADWAPDYLARKYVDGRQATMVWLAENLFVDVEGLVSSSALVAARMRVVRALCTRMIPALQSLYEKRASPGESCHMLQAMMASKNFMMQMREDIGKVSNDGATNGAITTELRVEGDESASVVASLDSLFEELGDWASEGMMATVAPTINMDDHVSMDLQDSDDGAEYMSSDVEDTPSEA